MADDIVLDHNLADHEEGAPEEIILDKPTVEETPESTQPAVADDKVRDKIQSDADAGNSHDVANVIEAIDAFLADPNDLSEESQSEARVEIKGHDEINESQEVSICESHDDEHNHAHVEEASVKTEDELAAADTATTNTVEEEEVVEYGAHTGETVEEAVKDTTGEAAEQDDTTTAEDQPRDLSATVEDETAEEFAEELAEQAIHQSAEPHEEKHGDEEEHEESHIAEPSDEGEFAETHEESFAQSVEDHNEQNEHDAEEADEEHEDHSIVEHGEADVSITEAALSHGGESQHEHHDEDEALEDEQVERGDHDNRDDSRHTVHDDEDVSRRSSASSSRSGVSNRRTSLRTEALIQAAARAVVAKINEKDSGNGHFDIMRAMSESHDSIMEEAAEADADHQTTTDEEAENDHDEGDAELDEDDVFSDRSPRSSLGSFEHNSGASNNGVDDGHQKMDHHSTAEDLTDHHESEDEQDYREETGSVAYHRETSHYSPRMSGVSGISRMSQYEEHQEHDDDEVYNDDEYVHHTIRGTPRAAFRTPSSVRAIQMSSPSPSVIFGVSPRSAARRRRLGTGSGLGDGQSMGSIGTYSSLPGSPNKNHTPTRFKVFRKPEPAPLVLLHATLMPTRWVWSDVLRTLDESMSRSASDRPSSRSPSSMGSPRKSHNKNSSSIHDDELSATAAFEPSAALKRLHGAWCQLQEYSLGADTVAERGVLLPHPQNDYEVLEERLLEALELPVRRRARILECGHYLGPADDEDEEEDYEDEDGYYNERAEEKGADKRHWCTTCRSDIRYESLGAERVFRVKVYASNGLMTVGAWSACWSEMERVDCEIEPIVADAALLRELNQLRALQQQEALRKQEEEDTAAEAAMHEEEQDEEEIHEDDLLHEHEEHDEHDHLDQHKDQEEHEAHDENTRSPPAVDHFHLEVPSAIPMSPPLRDSPVEPAAITTTDHAPDADRRRREAEDRLREIYGRTPPQMAHPAPPASHSHSHHVESTRLPDMPGTIETATTCDMNDNRSPYGPSPPSPSAEVYERREERRSHQFSAVDRGLSNDTNGSAAPHAQHPHQAPYESASLPELLVAAVKVFLRDRKHVAITVLSVIVIVLATLRSPGAGAGAGVGDQGATHYSHSVQSQAHGAQPAMEYSYQPVKGISDAHVGVAQQAAEASSLSSVSSAAMSGSVVDTLVETVVEKMTVKVYETVTETSTETATQMTVAATVTEAEVDISTTAVAETATVEAIESVVAAEPASATVVAEPQVEEEQQITTTETEVETEPLFSTSAASLSADADGSSLFAATDASTSAAEPTARLVEENDHNEL